MKKHNFSAGPSILPNEVFDDAAKAVLNLHGTGLSVLEISHRSKTFIDIYEETKSLVSELLGVPEGYRILFLSGGASSQFFMAPMNLLAPDALAAYVDTGAWSFKAIKEAKRYGQIETLASSRESNYTYIPKDYQIPTNAQYLHLTSNNTIYGTQYHEWPDTDIPFVCDMSSDIFSRDVPVDRFGLIYAGAQKNLGPAGTTLVIVKEDLLGKTDRDIPTMLDYRTHIKKDSAFNTPPVFPIYVSMLNLKWLKSNGGLRQAEIRNREKADVLYNELENHPLFEAVTAREDRSLMNIPFVLKNKGREEEFLAMSVEAGCVGLKGHRSVGGFRASMYNAMPKSSVEALVQVMRDFTSRYA